MPESSDESWSKKRLAVLELVKSVINEIKQDMTNSKDRFPSTSRYADDTATSIMEIFKGETE